MGCATCALRATEEEGRAEGQAQLRHSNLGGQKHAQASSKGLVGTDLMPDASAMAAIFWKRNSTSLTVAYVLSGLSVAACDGIDCLPGITETVPAAASSDNMPVP